METRPATQKDSIYLNPPKPFKIDEDIIMALIGILLSQGLPLSSSIAWVRLVS